MIIPVNDSRFGTSNIRLAAALCAMGFELKEASEPATGCISMTADELEAIARSGGRQRASAAPVITFWLSQSIDKTADGTEGKWAASDLELWWAAPAKFVVAEYDAELHAMRRAFEAREWLIGLAHGTHRLAFTRRRTGGLGTTSLCVAAIMKACGVEVVDFDRASRTFHFGPGAQKIYTLIASDSKKQCVNWMLAGLQHLDHLLRIVRRPEFIPLLEIRRGERVLRMSTKLAANERNQLMSNL